MFSQKREDVKYIDVGSIDLVKQLGTAESLIEAKICKVSIQ